MAPHRIMIVDDDKNVLKALRRSLANDGRELECYWDPVQAARRAQTATFDLFLCDFRMPGLDGTQFLAQVRVLQPNAVRMIISAHTDFDALVYALNEGGVQRFVSKPWDDKELKSVVSSALAARDALVENKRLAHRLQSAEQMEHRQSDELARLEREHPGITVVERNDDGSIRLDATESA